MLIAGLILGLSPALASAAPTYGPIIARGATGDQMMVHWGTSAMTTPTVQYRLKGAAQMSRQVQAAATATEALRLVKMAHCRRPAGECE
jgi:hypothetical protein